MEITCIAVFDEERRRVDAWAKAFEENGYEAAQEAERNEVLMIRKEKDEADERNREVFAQMMRDGQEIKRQRELENGTPDRPVVNQFSGESIIPIPESEELRQLRESRLNRMIISPDDTDSPVTTTAPSPAAPPPSAAGDKWIQFDIVEESEATIYDTQKHATSSSPEAAVVISYDDPLAVESISLAVTDQCDESRPDNIGTFASSENALLNALSLGSEDSIKRPEVVSTEELSTDLYELD